MSSRLAMIALGCTILFATGCGPNPLVGEVEAMRDEMCACQAQDCAERILKQLKEFDKTNKGKKVARKDNDTMQKLYGEISDCLVQVTLKEREQSKEKASAEEKTAEKDEPTTAPSAVEPVTAEQPKAAPEGSVDAETLTQAMLALRTEVCACTEAACAQKYSPQIKVLFAQAGTLKSESEKAAIRTSKEGIEKCVARLAAPAEEKPAEDAE